MNCERAEQLISCHFDGALDAEVAAAVQLHCDECESCAAELSELVKVASLMTSLEEDMPVALSEALVALPEDKELATALQSVAEAAPETLRERIMAATVCRKPLWPIWLTGFRPVRFAAVSGCVALAAFMAWSGMNGNSISVEKQKDVVSAPAESKNQAVVVIDESAEVAVVDSTQKAAVRRKVTTGSTGRQQAVALKAPTDSRQLKAVPKPADAVAEAAVVVSEPEPEISVTAVDDLTESGVDLGGPVKVARSEAAPVIAGSLDEVHQAAAEKAKLRRSRVLASADTAIALGPKPEQITILEARF